MLYPTHKKFGYAFGWLALIIAYFNGWMVSMATVQGFTQRVIVLLMTVMAIRGAVFGSGFPDIDSKGSVPARHYPFLRKIFKAFNVKHRGKVSHDVLSITIIFAVWYFIIYYLVKVAQGSMVVTAYLTVRVCYIIARDISNQAVYIIIKDRKRRARVNRILKPFLAVIVYVAFMLIGLVQLSGGVVGIVRTLNTIAPLIKIWVIFGYIGALSHLFADMLTNDGIWFFGQKLAPAQIVLVVRKIPIIGKKLLPSKMRTGTAYEDAWNLFITVLLVPLIIIGVIGMFGGDVSAIINMLRG